MEHVTNKMKNGQRSKILGQWSMVNGQWFSKPSGFTLIELLLVMAIIAILSSVVSVALNPIQRFRDARNSRRWSAVNNLLTAVHECIVDNDGVVANCVGSLTADQKYEIVNTGASGGCDDVCVNVNADTNCTALDSLLAAYLKELPPDPGGAAANHTEYEITVDANNIITITACSAETPETYGAADTIYAAR